MAAPQRPFFPQPNTFQAPRGGGRTVLAVGRRVLVTCPASGNGRVTLANANGTTVLATLPDGAEVEILAWQPRGPGGTRYWIRSRDDVNGWVAADNLRAPEPPPRAATAPTPPPTGAPKGSTKAVPPRAVTPRRASTTPPTKPTRKAK